MKLTSIFTGFLLGPCATSAPTVIKTCLVTSVNHGLTWRLKYGINIHVPSITSWCFNFKRLFRFYIILSRDPKVLHSSPSGSDRQIDMKEKSADGQAMCNVVEELQVDKLSYVSAATYGIFAFVLSWVRGEGTKSGTSTWVVQENKLSSLLWRKMEILPFFILICEHIALTPSQGRKGSTDAT